MRELSETLICWTPKQVTEPMTGQLALLSWPDTDGHSRAYLCTDGACWDYVHEFTKAQRTQYLVQLALKLIVRDRLAPKRVHDTLCGFPEYREYVGGISLA